MEQIQTQNESADIPVIVGVSNVKTMIFVDSKIFIPQITLKISTLNNRGIHMSRLIESLTESINKISTASPSSSMEEYANLVYLDLKKRHPFDYFNLLIETELAVDETTPYTKLKTIEVHDINFRLIVNDDNMKKIMGISVYGGSACPHGLINNKQGRTHLQRSQIDLSFEFSDIKNISYDTLLEICNKSFSSPVYTLLKTNDEQTVINNLFENPYFVEDIVRNVIKNSAKKLSNGILKIKVKNFESIHRHDVISEMELRI